MTDQNNKIRPGGKFSFGLFIFSLFIFLPAMLFVGWAYNNYLHNESRMECMKQGRTYVNNLCLQQLR